MIGYSVEVYLSFRIIFQIWWEEFERCLYGIVFFSLAKFEKESFRMWTMDINGCFLYFQRWSQSWYKEKYCMEKYYNGVLYISFLGLSLNLDEVKSNPLNFFESLHVVYLGVGSWELLLHIFWPLKQDYCNYLFLWHFVGLTIFDKFSVKNYHKRVESEGLTSKKGYPTNLFAWLLCPSCFLTFLTPFASLTFVPHSFPLFCALLPHSH